MKDSWISVFATLPEMMESSDYRSSRVIVTDGKNVWFTHRHVTGECWCSDGTPWAGEITHWQYVVLPKIVEVTEWDGRLKSGVGDMTKD